MAKFRTGGVFDICHELIWNGSEINMYSGIDWLFDGVYAQALSSPPNKSVFNAMLCANIPPTHSNHRMSILTIFHSNMWINTSAINPHAWRKHFVRGATIKMLLGSRLANAVHHNRWILHPVRAHVYVYFELSMHACTSSQCSRPIRLPNLPQRYDCWFDTIKLFTLEWLDSSV